jgi:poly-gamma-glutamate synthesis protein (capsule biosynthesis protein)
VVFRSILLGLVVASCAERPDAQSPDLRLSERRTKVAASGSASATLPAELLPTVAAEPVLTEPPEAAAALPPNPELEEKEEPRIVLAAGGDVNFGRECGQYILKDVTYDPFAGLGAAWTSADLRFVNLESQLSDQQGVTQNPGNRLIFTGPPGGADVLALRGVSVVSTANNHAWDYGKSALLETIDNLTRARVAFAGTGRDAEQAYAPVVLRAKARSIALFAVTHIWNNGTFATHEGRDYVAWASVDKLRPNIERARREHDFVILSYHGGAEYVPAPVDRTKRFVAELMALGVDAIIGHHPHVPQGIGWFDGRPIVYSLGNFVFAGHDNRPWTKASFFARLTLQKGAPPQVDACPVGLDGHRPRSFSLEREKLAFERFRLHLLGLSISTGGAEVARVDEQGCLRVTPKLL